jgi:hypothetical protein
MPFFGIFFIKYTLLVSAGTVYTKPALNSSKAKGARKSKYRRVAAPIITCSTQAMSHRFTETTVTLILTEICSGTVIPAAAAEEDINCLMMYEGDDD